MSVAESTRPRPAAGEDAPPGREPIRWRAELAWAAGASTLSLLLAAIVLQLWDASLHIPFLFGGDSTASLVDIKAVVRDGWLGINDQLGAPYGQVRYDHAGVFGEATQLMIIRLLAIPMSDPAAILNVYFLLGYPLITVSAYAVLRMLGIDRPVAAAAAVIFAMLPYRILRGPTHLMLSAYYAVPLGCLLILGLLGRFDLFRRRAGATGWRTWLSGRTALTVGLALFVGLSDAYYALFTVVIAGAVGLLAAVARSDWRRLVATAVVAGTVIAGMLVAQAPVLIYNLGHEANDAVAERVPWESELYGLRITSLVLPLPDHRLQGLADLSNRYYDQTQLNGEGSSAALGLLMTLGLIGALAVFSSSGVGRRIVTARGRLARDAGAAALLTILIGTVSGVSALIAYLGDSPIRGWNRISVFIGFFALVALAAALSGARQRWFGQGRMLGVGLGILLALTCFAAWDQTPAKSAFPYEAVKAGWQNDARFGAAVTQALPAGSKILQLPYVPYPEFPPRGRMVDYDHFKGYLHADTMQWSYGAMKGRYPDDWGAFTEGVPTEELVDAAAASGFRAIYVDRWGYDDDGAQIVAELEQAIGSPPVVTSGDGRLVLFDLQPVIDEVNAEATPAEREDAREALLEPVTTTWGDGFTEPEGPPGSSWRWGAATGTLTITNPTDEERDIRLSFRVATPGGSAERVTVTTEDGRTRTIRTRADATPVPFSMALAAPPGTSVVRFATTAPDEGEDPRDLRMQLFGPRALDEGYDELTDSIARP